MTYVVGVDGGATKTAAILADAHGHILNRATATASNYHAVGRESAGQALHKVIHDVLGGAGLTLADCSIAVFGLAGVNNQNDHTLMWEEIQKIGLPGQVHLENDIVIAWAAATACQPGVVVIAGTGSSAFGVNAEGRRYKSLGWDYIVADQGSGYWVGLCGLQVAIKLWDGRLPHDSKTLLLSAALKHFEVSSGEAALVKIYSDEFLKDMKTNVASFSIRVAECAAQGDPYAQTILYQAGEELADGVCAVIRELGMAESAFLVGRVGSTFNSGDYLLKPFTERIHALAPQAVIEEARYRAQVGALIYGYNELGMLNDDLLANLPRRD
jgi:N-acetylglucosamine kinase-like BadF-type ATPase